ncbi:ribonucleoside-diphosphate reductase, adenosylcobalamin-dependent [candidate division Kazan bacterium RIFCSPHIGHO2_01_FULL_49_10]|uniref:Vitamin B12-dependent ribonucleotide reductase n=1 Tax=candidate division Kazan bacterium RIFCSPLOWO2_01_FULL_48_13 TaxID=1798539 RepID=A0A1F4PNX8_UNCK3|nr:MAG: ribonucleoside-diphosphate reductase, adenosylcobalamin-dependent [candidate division Kazan bacterium RIFCSPHIGHO2_01_FULL_49_10]OGB85335.1 MAG: ribonucleoside-diphosphate reductase, adenosylcobalamin-dependent [candidate division Kazan bacterium RIFCSPLOWO2_01_FULL_48_13]
MALTKIRTGRELATRYFTHDGDDVFAEVKWNKRRAYIYDAKQDKALIDVEVEAPDFWSDTAVNIAAYKYLRKRGIPGPEGRETSVRQLIDRVANALTQAGEELGYFESLEESKIFKDELSYLLLHQKGAFNSPVWFNVGLWHNYHIDKQTENFYYNTETNQVELSTGAYQHPQCSACFIQSIEDSLESIFELVKRESRLFKYGSGTGTNFSNLRSKYEQLSNGGTSSGLLSFLKVFDTGAGATKSGGTTRRAAKMVILDVDHPEIEDFIKLKAREEDKAFALIQAGYDDDFNGEAYHTVTGQNANNSVRVTDSFMQAYLSGGTWQTKFKTTGEVHKTYPARDLMRMIAESAWRCADPGMQYDTTVNRWHTCKMSGRINASNPCSEYMFLDDTACNLASIRLTQFVKPDGEFDVEAFRRAVEIFILAQEIIVDFASYPYPDMALNSHKFRTLGLGYADLGAYLMQKGLPYDSAEGRSLAAAITAIMTGHAYAVSAEIAGRVGAFSEYQLNRESMLDVIRLHHQAATELDNLPDYLKTAVMEDWDRALELGQQYGFRNAQVSLLAPTGTIGPLMDVDTTGIEPDFALVKYKKLAGGGGYSIVNQSVEPALKYLGYGADEIAVIKQYILDNSKIEGAPNLHDEHLVIFDCANKCGDGERFIRASAHVEMMVAVQPFLSGAISKTVNMPNEATVDEIEEIYVESWRKGLKALAIYRDGSKSSQPLTTRKDSGVSPLQIPTRTREMPKTRAGLTHKFSIGGHKIYITANRFEDGDLGEIFITAGKEGSIVNGLLGTIARLSSKMLQEGVGADTIIDSLLNLRFDPWGITDNPEIPMAKSMPDYIARWLGKEFLPLDRQVAMGLVDVSAKLLQEESNHHSEPAVEQPVLSISTEESSSTNGIKYAPPCPTCGALMIRNGTCFSCRECGTTTGCS